MPSTPVLRKHLPLALTLAVGVIGTLFAWQFTLRVENQRAEHEFEQHVELVTDAVFDRFATYEQVLRGGVALFYSSQEVTRDEWRSYVENLQVEGLFPGIQGIGYAVNLAPGQLQAHEETVQADGFPQYQVHPHATGEQPPSSAIMYLEPFDYRNQRAFGYDMYSNQTRREAMARARDSGQPALSGRVILLQETGEDNQPGTLLYVPVYKRGLPVGTTEQRRAALTGWVYSPFRMIDLMRGILGHDLHGVRLRLFDGAAPTEAKLLFDSAPDAPVLDDVMSKVQQVNVAGQPWTMAVSVSPGAAASGLSQPTIILLGGLLMTLALAGVVISMRGAEERAGRLAWEMTDALRASERRFRAILEHTADGILTIDERGIVRSFNKAAEAIFGYSADEVIGRNVSQLMPERYRAQHDGYVARMETSASHRNLGMRREVVGLRRDGEEFPVWLAVNKIPTRGEMEYVGMVSDLTERKRIQAELQYTAHHDALTTLPNRAVLKDRLDQAIRHARRAGNKVAVLMLDLDHFKRINDTLGHHVGDDLLISIALRLEASVRDVDTVVRMGGDEFVIVLPSVNGRDDVVPVVEKLMRILSQPISVVGHEMIITPSIGVCLCPDDGQDERALLKHADTAMYQAKAAGRGNYQFFETHMMRTNQRRLETETALRRALDRGEFSLRFQPQINIHSGQLIGCEALVRWHHPQLGDVSPALFIPMAEEMGLIGSIGDWVMTNACQQAVQMQQELGQPLHMAVNISPQQFFRNDIISSINRALAMSGFPASQLEVEITEGVLLENSKETVQLLHKIRSLGVSLAVDDFGTGYSSLSYLTRFPIDKLKIDQSFVRDITLDASDAAVASAIIAMAHSLKLAVVAEGVETLEQYEFLSQRQCDVAQGFYFGRPVTKEEFIASAQSFQGQPTLADKRSTALDHIH